MIAADDPRHGTANGYSNLGCHCEACRAAHAAWMREARQRRRARLAENGDVEHGSSNTYLNHGCRCVPCTTAHSDVRKSQRL